MRYYLDTNVEESVIRDALDGLDYTLTSSVPALPEAPCPFLFGIDDPFDTGGIYVWIVAEPYFNKYGYADDSSSASSALIDKNGQRRYFEDDGDEDNFLDDVNTWLSRSTKGILYGEGMESAWEAGIENGESRDQAVERVKAGLIARGFKHQPELDSQMV